MASGPFVIPDPADDMMRVDVVINGQTLTHTCRRRDIERVMGEMFVEAAQIAAPSRPSRAADRQVLLEGRGTPADRVEALDRLESGVYSD